jgi:hypothetical protein
MDLCKHAAETAPDNPHASDFGIYCLGHDGMLDWIIGLLESLKEHAPHCRVFVIPFDHNVSRLAALRDGYRFEFYQSDALPALEELAWTQLGKSAHAAHVFRKLSVFWGPLKHFLFLDADIVVQEPVDGLFEAYKRSGLQFAFSDTNIAEVYKPGALRETMQAHHGAQGFNSGCFLSSRGALTLAEAQAAAAQAARIKSEFVSQYEQSFLNYLVDTSGLRQGSFADFCAGYGPKVWASLTPLREYHSRCWLMAGGTPLHPMPMLHWAGYACESGMPNARRFLRYRLRHGAWPERLAFLRRFSRRQRAKIAGSLSPRPLLGRLCRKIRSTAPSQKRAPRDTVPL